MIGNSPSNEVENLKDRIKKLSHAKSHLQLLSDLLTNLAKVSGVRDTLQHSIDMIMETIGGSYIIIYYKVEEQWHTYDMYGVENKLDDLDDQSVLSAVSNGVLVEDQIDVESNTLMSVPLKTADWIFPLRVGVNVFGAFKIGGIRLTLAKSVKYQLDVYMNYIGLMLHSEIVNFSRLRVAYDKLQIKNEELEREIAERRRAEKELVSYRDHLEKLVEKRTNALKKEKAKAEIANKAKSEFLANMSHEIRTPLNAVTGFSELLSSLVTDPKQKSYIESIKTAGKSLLTLINDILDLSKIEAGRLEIQYSPIDLRTIIREVEQIFTMQTSRKNIRLIIDIDEALPFALQLDEIRLRQVLLNIVGNSVKFTEKGYIKISVHVNTINKNGDTLDINILVEDSGIGISENDKNRIFESFKQQAGQRSSMFGGTGLGLTICKRLIEMMNGKISVESVLGKGSIFKINIQNVEVSFKEIPVIEETLNHESVKFKKGKVLVVDDVESNRNLLYELLSKVNLDVLTAENGHEAIVISPEYQPDIILMDIRMPVMDGYEATKQLKNKPKTKAIPIIAVTASSSTIKQTELLEKGFDGLIPKPVKINRLLSELNKYFTLMEEETTFNTDAVKINCQTDQNISQKASSIPSEIIKILESDFMERWEQFQDKQPIEDVKDFGKELKIIGQKNHIDFLSEYGERLMLHVNNFDVNNMQASINEFPKIILILKGGHNGN